jgi:hypothetical protein
MKVYFVLILCKWFEVASRSLTLGVSLGATKLLVRTDGFWIDGMVKEFTSARSFLTGECFKIYQLAGEINTRHQLACKRQP